LGVSLKLKAMASITLSLAKFSDYKGQKSSKGRLDWHDG